ncbi:M48 family metalloprotease [Opitutus terrae]|uniref:Peptidase M48 Ste24p n=1 Tax=Opitutus terrae (strain DSM 11246 / JCM 15787 / PB90-1) TaxID=452637 RepID=B1ZNL8_OPITP|nr:M48 family metalloprotease [Opitutus terrae]ACB74452.1 peptidase M48 Ste24p [Opitutus terrae PB90-1]
MTPQPPPLAPTAPVGLTPANLTVPKEASRFVIVLILSILVWLALAVTMIGLFYAVIFGFFLWLGNGLLTAYLRAEAVRVGPEQLPELDASLRDVCQKLGVRDVPALYVLQSGGLLNAFATRFAGRDFVVVYSDFLEALGPASPEMRFILGHELGHIQSRHILKQIFLAPGLFFPLIGPAYRRAWETSCDRFGAYAAQDVNAAVRAMLVLSGGREHGPQLNAAAFASQHASERGFFVSLHELTSTYPTLSRRVTELMALTDDRAIRSPGRNPFAYFFALFLPGGNVGQGGPLASLLLIVVIIGLLAAMAIPAFEKVRQRSQAIACVNNQRQLAAALDQYQLEEGKGADAWSDVTGAGKFVPAMPVCPAGGTYNATYEDKGARVICTVAGHDPTSVAAARGARSGGK